MKFRLNGNQANQNQGNQKICLKNQKNSRKKSIFSHNFGPGDRASLPVDK
jgi:hypothetical protein